MACNTVKTLVRHKNIDPDLKDAMQATIPQPKAVAVLLPVYQHVGVQDLYMPNGHILDTITPQGVQDPDKT
jgi:hypothetical protein